MDSYLWYLENVLGLKSVIWPTPPPVEEVAVPEHVKLPTVVFVDSKAWSQPATDLFQKMREAMKLLPEQITILNASQVSASELQVAVMAADRVVCFSSELFESLHKESDLKFKTHSPEELLKKPELKKQAWEDLKLVMKSLGLL
jgi:hypothetical protein